MRNFNIPFAGLANKVHQFSFEVGKSFFTHFDSTNIEECDVQVKLDFEKRETFFHLKFYIDGTVQVPCDRCLEPFDQEIFGDYELFVKFSDDPDIENNIEDDIIIISRNDDHLDVSKPIYDYILVSIPLRCVHPEDKDGNSACNKEVLARLEKKEEVSADPRWAALEKLRNKKQ